MKIALSSAPVKNKDIPHNLAAMTAAIAQAAADGADLVVFGESTLQGFDCLCWSYAADRDMALQLDSAPIRQLQDAARKYATAISFGFIAGRHIQSESIPWKHSYKSRSKQG